MSGGPPPPPLRPSLASDEHTPLLPARSHSHDDDEETGRSTTTDKYQTQPSTKSVVAIITVLLAGIFVGNVDGSIVLATHGTIASEFKELSNSSWIVTSFALAVAAAQPLVGKLSDIYGRKAVLQASNTLFALGCAGVGIALSFPMVILGRVVSGVGGAGMSALVSILITELVPLRDVATWRSYVNIVATTGRSLGGPIGGYLADTIGWRWSFFGQAPIIAAAMVFIWIVVPGSHPSDDSVVDSSELSPNSSKLSRIDFLGSGLLALSILAFLLPLELGGQRLPWSHPTIWFLFGTSVVLAALFVLTEAYYAKEPVFPLRLLRQRNVMTTYLVVILQVAAQMGMMFTVPIYFQVTARATATAAGAHLFPAVGGNAIGGLLTGFLIKRTGRYKFLVCFASAIAAVSYVLLILRWHGHTGFWESLYIFPGGFGSGISGSALFIALSAAIEPTHMAIASGGLYLCMNIGMVTGLAGVSSILQSVLHGELEKVLAGIPNGDIIIDRATSDLKYVAHLDGWLREAVVEAYLKALDWAHGLSLLWIVLAFLVTFFVREYKL